MNENNLDTKNDVISDNINKTTENHYEETHLMQGNAVVVVNLDELADDLAEYLKNGLNVDIGDVVLDTKQIETLLQKINDKIPEAIDLNELMNILGDLNATIKDLGYKLGIEGIQKIYGDMLDIPSIKDKFELKLKAPQDGYLTGISYSQSTWSYLDYWVLQINNEIVFNKIYTKEFGECKHFNNFREIKKGDIVKFIYYNNMACNKVVWVDFELLEKENIKSQNKKEVNTNETDE